MDDTISRQASIEAIEEYIDEYNYLEDGYHNPKWCAMQEAKMTIQRLPSAERTGRWEWEGFNIVCSECDYSPCFDSTEPLYHFCPNCGARMEVE